MSDTIITPDLLSEITHLAEKATPGEWWIDSHGHCLQAFTDDEVKTVFRADDRMGCATRHPETGNLSHWPNDWDASYIVSVQPQKVSAMIARIQELEQALAMIRDEAKAMGFPWATWTAERALEGQEQRP